MITPTVYGMINLGRSLTERYKDRIYKYFSSIKKINEISVIISSVGTILYSHNPRFEIYDLQCFSWLMWEICQFKKNISRILHFLFQ